MADVLAIHWERRRLHAIEASLGSVVRVNRDFVVDIPEGGASGWLRDALRKNGVTAKHAVVGISREDAILRHLELPNAPEDELPALVHFQASTRSTTPLDQLLLDFMPLPERIGTEQKDVLVASIPRATLEPIRTALAEAGVDLTSLSISSFALAEFGLRIEASRNLSSTRRSLLVLEDANRLEVVLLGNQQPIVTHLIRAIPDDNGRPTLSKAAADISRILVPAQPWLFDQPIERIWIVGNSTDWQGLGDVLGQRWACPVEHVDAQTKIAIPDLDLAKLKGSLAEFTPALGLALGRLHRRSPGFDLLHPRQPKPKRDPRKLQLAFGSAVALIIVALATSYVQLTMMSLEERIAKAKDIERERTGELKKGEPFLVAAKTIDDWTSHDVNQIKQFTELNEFMQGTSRLYLSDYLFGPSANDAIAKLQASGNARARIDSQSFENRLVDSRRFRVKPPRQANQQSRDPDYSHRFDLDTDLIPASKAPAAGPASPKAK